MAAALEQGGMEVLDSHKHRTNKQIQAFIKVCSRPGTSQGLLGSGVCPCMMPGSSRAGQGDQLVLRQGGSAP